MEPDPDPNDDPLNSMFPLDGDENKIVKGCMKTTAECNDPYKRYYFPWFVNVSY